MSTVKFICYKSKSRKDGRHPITLRITSGTKRNYLSTGYWCHLSEWDDENEALNNTFSSKNPSRTAINAYLVRHRAVAQQIDEQFKRDGLASYSAEQFLKLYQNTDKIKTTAFTVFEKRIAELEKADRIGNAEMYKTVYSAFRKWVDKDLLLRDVTPELLEEWTKDLKDSEVKDTTISAYLRTLRALFNYAISKRLIREEYYPFREFKVSQFSTETSPRALEPEKLEEFLSLEVFPDLQFAKDIFVFSFYGRGISFIDIALLTSRNIQNGGIIYERKKLSKKPVRVTFPIRDEQKVILKRYQDQERGYLFPVLNTNGHINEQQKKDRIKKVRRKINSDLKKIGTEIGEPEMTSYWARHTYASYMFRKGMSPMMIKESLMHKNLKTTEIYIKSLGFDAINDFEEKVYGSIK